MHRFYLPPEQCGGVPLRLEGPEAHHAIHVLRLRAGDSVIVLNGAGAEYDCRVQAANRDGLQLDVARKNDIPPLPFQITLLQAIPKGKLFEAIIQKATELGAHRIVPILSERVATRIPEASALEKCAKWRRVAIEAIKQCGSAWLPEVHPPVTPGQFLKQGLHFEVPLIAALSGPKRHPGVYLNDFRAAHQRPPASACVWVGPEGDFTPGELEAIKSAGALPITLGRQVLRTETAAVYCLSILSYELQRESRVSDSTLPWAGTR